MHQIYDEEERPKSRSTGQFKILPQKNQGNHKRAKSKRNVEPQTSFEEECSRFGLTGAIGEDRRKESPGSHGNVWARAKNQTTPTSLCSIVTRAPPVYFSLISLRSALNPRDPYRRRGEEVFGGRESRPPHRWQGAAARDGERSGCGRRGKLREMRRGGQRQGATVGGAAADRTTERQRGSWVAEPPLAG
ncbi:hypothetical protein BRADI_3g18995v3 [Brachypodium distachyon]|uniref:Uncharacterized protein n=1 Tax=Brachypodium distachyon TaxID=15368 RepID=A0A2K2CY82_BRADI|nr:hypothetical protein BRADI_3g18995v3 [Brachypodium distachyon]PNT66971.1 hypothetical protein BRADI_3g18995v3 [Brachypodium distachyon]